MATNTTNYGFTLPGVNNPADSGLWGGYLNGNWSSLDNLLLTASNIVSRATTGTDNITMADQNKVILCNATSAAYAETLPAASSVSNGFKVIFKKTDSSTNAITITPNGTDTIDGKSTFVISAQYGFVALVGDHVSNWNIVSQSTVAVTAVKTINRQIITSSETYTPSTGMLYADVEVVASGAAGGTTAASGAASGGGGAGAYAKKVMSAATIGASQTVTIGAAGSNTTFGSIITCTPGVAGTAGSGSTPGAGGAGGTATGGDLNISGGSGGGGGYTSSGPAAGGMGGTSPIGPGGGGGNGFGAGLNGSGYGAGGGGGGESGGSSLAGGAATGGAVIITEYCSQ